jgi:hypothetical protein
MMPFLFPSAPHTTRHGPQGYADYRSYRPWLRDEFDFRCVYCLLREQRGRVRGTFHLDHFQAVAYWPEAELIYENLRYCCAACNEAKAGRLVPDPCRVLLDGDVEVRDDGELRAYTPEARQLIRKLGLNRPEAREFRRNWISIIALAKEYDRPLYERLMGYPDDLPDLGKLRPPGGNTRRAGLAKSHYERRRRERLSETS